MHHKDKTQYWILSLNSEFCTVDDLRFGIHGFVYDGVTDPIGVKEGDVAILFDSNVRTFRTLGRFLSSVGVGEVTDGGEVRHDFLLKISHKRNTATNVDGIRKELRAGKHPTLESKWPTQSFTKLTRREFDRLMEAWWGVKQLSLELRVAAGQQSQSGS